MKFRLLLALASFLITIGSLNADNKNVLVVDPSFKTILDIPFPERIDSIASYFLSSRLLAPQKIKIWNEQLSLLGKEHKLAQAKTHLNLAYEYAEIEQSNKAEEACLKVFPLISIETELDHNSQKVLGMAHGFLGTIYFISEDWKRTEESSLLAIEYFNSIPDTTYLANSIYNLGVALFKQNRYSESLERFKEAKELYKESDKIKYLDTEYWYVSSLIETQNEKKALTVFDSLIAQMKFAAHPKYSDALISYGDLLSSLKKYKAAEKNYLLAHGFAIENKRWNDLKKISSKIATLHESNNKLDKALEFRKILQVYADSFHISQSEASLEKSNQAFESFKLENLKMKEKYEMMLAASELKLNRNRKFINGFLLLSIFVFGMCCFFMIRKVNTNIVNKEIEVKSIKEKLFHTVSHEISRPVNLSQSYVQKLKKENLPEHIKGLVNSTDKTLNGLICHINTLIDWNKAESNSIVLNLSKQSYSEVLQSIFKNVKTTTQKEDIIWLLDIIPENLICELDFENLEKVVSILLKNAASVVSSGAIISMTSRIEKDNLLRIDIKDNGPGIPHDKASNLFDWEYASESFSAHQSNAFEINMSLANKLVSLMNGKLSFVNNNNFGTHFSLLLPFAFVKEKQLISQVSSIIGKTGKKTTVLLKPDEDRYNILLIEDHLEFSNFVSDTLSDFYNISIAHDPRIGLAISYKEIPDLIICDLILSKTNNLEIYEKLKNNILTDHIPILIFTSKKERRENYNLELKGHDQYLDKPFKPQDLVKLVEKMLDSHAKIDISKKLDDIVEGKELTKFETLLFSVIEQNYHKADFNADQFAEQIKMSKGQMLKKMKSMYHDNTSKILRDYRLLKSKQFLEEGILTVDQIASKCGFSSTEYFVTVYKNHFKLDPNDFS